LLLRAIAYSLLSSFRENGQMSEQQDFQQRVRRIGALVEEIETIADPAARSSTRQLVQLVMEFHGLALDRTLEILADGGEAGMSFIEQLGRDSMVSSLLVLYGLHPDSLETRVRKAVERLEPKLRRDSAVIELLGIEDGAVRIRVTPGGHACGSTTKAMQTSVEDAIYEAAPDIASLTIEGLDGQPASGFVALDKLTGPAQVTPTAESPAERTTVANYGD
jgi:Fe-S cluster biogenesis protein NfuA